MRISENVEMLELETVLANGPGKIHPVLVWDEKDVVLLDAGLPGMGNEFRKSALSAGVPFDRLNHVILTHSDMDHVGSLAEITKPFGGRVTILAHSQEKPYIECELLPIRVQQMEVSAGKAVGAAREQLLAMISGLKKSYTLFKAKVDQTIAEGDVLPFCGGILCIHTPGHTPGHMCYYFEQSKLLIAGDILQIVNGALVKCPDFTVLDKEALTASLKKLCRYEIKEVICYHGGLFRDHVSQRIMEISGE